MEIKVLGPGCPRCGEVQKRVADALAELRVPASVEKVTDIKMMMSYGILATPALVINGKVRCAGRIPSAAEITAWIREAAA
ncbi:MAG TPA: thioredoxin family protein [Candidatus Aminicenantes bacterium]|nr:thioredoxin family protein [Candidatus Aminicenantes bacterium]HRY63920.1 thioredoxin family protein [Candidatus Aminicenantes bacterium]HRZ70833.1 thioredoxin family protein [Candidatus Aminicenantes bacterium]